MNKKFLKWLSKWVPFKIPAGKNLTVEQPVEDVKTEIKLYKIPNMSPFFKVKPDLIIFEYIGTNPETKEHVLECVNTEEKITISSETLITMFKGVTVKVNFKV